MPTRFEGRWAQRFGAAAVAELRRLLETITGQLDTDLPEYLPIVGGSSWTLADAVGRREA